MSYVHYTPFSVIALLICGNIIFIHSLDQRYNINQNIDGVILWCKPLVNWRLTCFGEKPTTC